jgi:hypothetical protein
LRFLQALQSECENCISKLSPVGTAGIGGDEILESLQPSLRDFIMFHDVPRTNVLG